MNCLFHRSPHDSSTSPHLNAETLAYLGRGRHGLVIKSKLMSVRRVAPLH